MNIASSKPVWAYTLAKYLHSRSSRLGGKAILGKILTGRHYSLYTAPPATYLISARFGDSGDFTACNEVFVDRVYELERLPFTPELIVDAGAHIGTFTVLAHSRFPQARFVSIEPVQANFTLLAKNCSLNQVTSELHSCALADYEGTGSMEGDSSVGSQLVTNVTTTAKIPVRRLSSLLNLDGVQSLLLKCDTEGMEFQILSDILPKVPARTAVFLESHGGQTETQRLRDLLKDVGFSFAVTRSRGLYEDCVAIRSPVSP